MWHLLDSTGQFERRLCAGLIYPHYSSSWIITRFNIQFPPKPSEKASEMSELQPDATEPNLSHRHTEAFHSKSRIQKIRALICWSRETHICSYMRNGLIKQLEANAERHFSVFAIFHWSDPIINLNQSQLYWLK